MSSLIYIVEKATDSQSHYLELGDANSVTAKFGSVYSLIDSQTGKYPENVVLQQDEDHLLIVRDGEILLVIEEYFDEAREASFDDSGIILSDIALAGMESDVLVEEPIWSAETATTITLNAENSNQTTDLANSTQPKIDMSVPSSMRPQEGAPLQNGSTGSEAQEHNEDPSSGSQGAAGEMGWGWYAAALGLGAVGMASGSSSGGSSSSSGGGSASTSSTTISSAAGIFFSTVQIDLYDASGNLISSAEHDYSTGDYVYTGSYSGPMLVEIIDINGTSTDYTDETTGEAKSLGTSLRAMTTTDGASDKAISVTPLTELATQLAGVTSDNRAVTTDNVAMNGKVATLFGLDNILDKPAVVTEDTSSADAAALKYGQALAILSGADSDAGNASAAETIATIASSLKEANSDTSADLKLTSEVADILTKGLETFNDGPTGRDNAITSSFTFSSVPVLVNTDGDVIKAINAEVVASTIEVKIKGLSADTVVTLTVGENTTTYTVKSDDIESGYAYVPITASWFQADGDGNYDVVVTVNNVESSTTIKVDTIAPEAPTFALHQDTGDSDNDGITSDTTVDVTLADGVTNWQYSLDGGSTWITRTSGSSFELKGTTTYNVGDIQVKQIDKAGNESDVTSNTSAIETLETLAPDLSIEDTGTSNSDGITNSSTVSVTFDDGVDLASWQYSLDGGSTWKDGTGTTFELAANKTYQADTIQVKQIDTQGNEEIATLSSKVVTDNTVSAPVTFLAEDSGQNKTDGITSDTTYRVKLANDMASWEYSVDSGANWVTGSGTSFELNENQTYAVGSIQVRQTDVAGNVSGIKSNTTAITTDLIAPDAPSASLRNDTGASDEDGITNNTTVDVALADDAVSWQYSLDGGETWSASQAASVTSFALADNTAYQAGDLQIRQYDAAGNVSVVDSNDQIITLDSVVSAPTLSFSLTSNDLTSTTVTVTLADDVASWEYSLDGGETWNEGSGERFSLAPLTAYDANAIQVRQTDIAGNVSDIVANESLETDVAIDPPSFELASDTGIAADDSITSSATMNVTLLGGDEGAVSWNYSLDGGITWSDDQDISTTTFDLADNTTYDVGQILVTQTDAEGNVSAFASNDNTVIVDSLVGAPEFSLNTDTGSSDTDGITNDLTVNVDLADDVATWQYSLDSGSTWLDGSGTSFELAANVSYAAGAIQVKQIDLAGNESTATLNDSNIITDTIPLDAPTFSLNSDTGSSDTDNITNDSVVNVVLSEDAATWQYSTDAGITWQTGTGTSFDLAANTTYLAGDIQVQQIDVAGNTSASASNDATIEIDTTAQTPTLSLNVDSGIDDSDGITNVMQVDFGSNGESTIQSWEYSLDNGANWTEGSGSSFILADNTSYAVGSIQVRQTDLAGNLSAVGSNSTAIVTDTIPLAAPSFTLHEDTGDSDSDFITSDTTIDVTLDAEAASWEYSLDSGATWTEGSGTSFEMGALQTYEIGQIQVRQLDIAGNISAAASNEVPFVSDSLPAPTVQLAEDTGLSDSDNITNDLTVNVTLDLNAASWVYSLDSGATWVDGEGSSFELEADTTYAVGSIQVKQFDADENESAIYSNESEIVADNSSMQAMEVGTASVIQIEVDDGSYIGDRQTISLENGKFVTVWIQFAETSMVGVQYYNADGSESGLPYFIPTGQSYQEYYLQDVFSVSSDSGLIVAWTGETYDKNTSEQSGLYFQLFNADGAPVGEVHEATDDPDWSGDSWPYPLGDTGNYILTWTENVGTGQEAYAQRYDSNGNPIGSVITIENSVVPTVLTVGGSGAFILVWNEVLDLDNSLAVVKAQSYGADGLPNGNVITLTQTSDEMPGEYLERAKEIGWGDNAALAAILVDETNSTLNLQVVNVDTNVSTRIELGEFTDSDNLATRINFINEDHDFAVSWTGADENGDLAVFTQTFSQDGAALSEAKMLPITLDPDSDYKMKLYVDWLEADESYLVTTRAQTRDENGNKIQIFELVHVQGDTITSIISAEDNVVGVDVVTLNTNGDFAISGVTFESSDTAHHNDNYSWFQLFNLDGSAKTEQIIVSNNTYSPLRFTVVNDDGDFVITSSSSNGATNIHMYYADGSPVLETVYKAGDDVAVTASEDGIAYLVSAEFSIETLDDILALDDGSWRSVTVYADSASSFATEGLANGEYFVYVTDVAGNIAQSTSIIEIQTLLAEPDVVLNNDTGKDDDDGVTSDTQVNVTLTGGAVRWEYSLDHGVTWLEGQGTSFNLTDNTEFKYNDLQIRQYDENGNVSEIAANSDGYIVTDSFVSAPQIEIVGTTAFVTLDDDLGYWDYSLDGGETWTEGVGDSFSLEPNMTYQVGDIVVYQEDLAGNEAEFTYNQIVETPDAYEAPSFELFDDTGLSDSDGVTYESSLNVFLSDDAVAYEYSLDGGETWQHGSGAYILLADGESFPASDFVGYEYDADGNESEMMLDYPEDEDVDFAIGFDVAEGTVSWRYSKDGGDTFTEVQWNEVDGYFINLDSKDEYDAGDILVRQINSSGEVSLAATNEQAIIIDDNWPYDLIVAPSTSKLEGVEQSNVSYFQESYETVLLGNTGQSAVVWIESIYAESGTDYRMIAQRLDTTGDSVGDAQVILSGNANGSPNIEDVLSLGNSGSFIVFLRGQDESFNSVGYYQIVDENGAVGDIQSLAGDYFNASISAIGDNGNFVVITAGYANEAYFTNAQLMDVNGELITQLENREEFNSLNVKSLGTDGSFVLYDDNSVSLYSSEGTLINSTTVTPDSYSMSRIVEDVVELDTNGSYLVLTQGNTTTDTSSYSYISVYAFNADGSSQGSTIDVAQSAIQSSFSNVNIGLLGNGGYVVTWSENNQNNSESVTYLQAFNSDGSTNGAQINPLLTSEIGRVYGSSLQLTGLGSDGSYLLSGQYNVYNSETNYYENEIYFVDYISADGTVSRVRESESYNQYALSTVGDDGAFVIAWNRTDLVGYGVSVQLYNADGTANGETLLLEVNEYSFDRSPSIIDLGNGEFAVSWMGDTYNQNGTSTNVYIQKFNADGTIVDNTIVDTNGEVSVTSNEDGVAYLVNSSLFADDFLSDDWQWNDGLFETTLNADDANWNSVEVTAGEEAKVSADGLEPGTYYVLVTDLAGNVNVSDVGITVNEAPKEIVFDLTTGESTDLDGQVFSADETYDIYINVGDGSNLMLNMGEQWSGAENLGDDDTIILVSDAIVASFSASTDITWELADSDAVLTAEGEFTIAETVDLWQGAWASNPDAGLPMYQVIATETPEV